MSDREWNAIAVEFMRQMGVEDRPWVAVRHGADHIHVVVSRVAETGEVWHGRNDRRQAQTVCSFIEDEHGLVKAPRRRVGAKRMVSEQRAMYGKAAQVQPDVLPGQISREHWESYDKELQDTIRSAQPERVPQYARSEHERARFSKRTPQSQQRAPRPRQRSHSEVDKQRGLER